MDWPTAFVVVSGFATIAAIFWRLFVMIERTNTDNSYRVEPPPVWTSVTTTTKESDDGKTNVSAV